MLSVMFADLVDGQDVRMIQARGRLGLALETLHVGRGCELAREDQPITKGLNGYFYPGLVVMAYAPPNFVPIAWTVQGQKWIKFLRVPVER